jgi:hypothetical protein
MASIMAVLPGPNIGGLSCTDLLSFIRQVCRTSSPDTERSTKRKYSMNTYAHLPLLSIRLILQHLHWR